MFTGDHGPPERSGPDLTPKTVYSGSCTDCGAVPRPWPQAAMTNMGLAEDIKGFSCDDFQKRIRRTERRGAAYGGDIRWRAWDTIIEVGENMGK